MKIKFEEDYIYLSSGSSAKLILHNCKHSCKFCPAGKLKSFYNYSSLNMNFDYDCDELTIYGNLNCTYMETFIKKLKSLNPKIKIRLYGCCCESSQPLDLEYYHIIYPNLVTYFSVMPKEFILPATGDTQMLLAFAIRQRTRYPDIPLVTAVTEAADQDTEFWTESQIADFMKQVEINCPRI